MNRTFEGINRRSLWIISAGRSQANNVLPATQSVGRVAEVAGNPPGRLLSEVEGIVGEPAYFVKLIVLIGLIK